METMSGDTVELPASKALKLNPAVYMWLGIFESWVVIHGVQTTITKKVKNIPEDTPWQICRWDYYLYGGINKWYISW